MQEGPQGKGFWKPEASPNKQVCSGLSPRRWVALKSLEESGGGCGKALLSFRPPPAPQQMARLLAQVDFAALSSAL